MPQWVETYLPFLAIVLVTAVLLAVALRRIGRLRQELWQAQQSLAQDHERMGDERLRQDEERQRDLAALRGAMETSTQLYGSQVETALRQSQEIARMLEERQQNLQSSVEAELRRIQERLRLSDESQARALSQNETRMETLRKALDDGMRGMREETGQQLGVIRKTVDEKLTESLDKRLSESFSQVSQRLEQVYKSLGEMNSLAAGVGDLKRMLGNVKTRGIWGEIQLGALLEQVFTEKQYERNVAVRPGSAERVEYAVVLPGNGPEEQPVYLPIDSKFPQEDYARLADASQAGDQAAVEAAQKGLMNAVKAEAKRIGKYIAPPNTTDFAVMFLPLESLYAEVMRHSLMVESIQREQRVLISGPSTLLALLNSLQMGFRTLAIQQRSAEVWKLLGAVKTDFGSFAQVLERTQDKLRQASESIENAYARTRNIQKRLRDVEALDAAEAAQFSDSVGQSEG